MIDLMPYRLDFAFKNRRNILVLKQKMKTNAQLGYKCVMYIVRIEKYEILWYTKLLA